MSKEQFVETKEEMDTDDFCEKYHIDRDTILSSKVLCYKDGYYIEDFGVRDYKHKGVRGLRGQYYLIIERDDWVTNDLKDLETLLYEFYVDNVDLEHDPDT